jgi:cell division transport system permease protein
MKFFKSAWKNIRRSPYQAIGAIYVMTLIFLAFSIFTITIFSASRVISYLESRPQVTAFFKDEAKQSDIEALKNSLNKSGLISSVKFVSKEQALQIYKDQNKNDPLLLDLVTADILPASLEISTYQIEDLNLVSETLKKSNIVDQVVFQKEMVSKLTSITNVLRKSGLVIVALLAIVFIFIMMMIIGTRISQKREDIETMRLIGASSWYIRWPFILEGVFYGLFGTLIGWFISVAVLLYITPILSGTEFLKGLPIFPLPPVFLLELLGIEILFAIILGAFSSYLAVLRYLK